MTTKTAPAQLGTLTITRRALAALVAQVLPAAPARTMLPILGNLLFEAADGTLTLVATDLDLTVRVRGTADVEAKKGTRLTFTLPARAFAQIVRDLDTETVTLLVAANHVTIVSGRARFKLSTLDANEFPVAPTIDFAAAVTLPARAVMALADATRYAASTEESRPILCGVLVEPHADGLRMVATDGHRMAIATASAVTAAGLAQSIVPGRAFDALAKLLTAEGTVSVASNGNQIAFRDDASGALVTSRLIEGPYPNYQQVVPAAGDTAVETNKAALVAVLRRAAVVASASNIHRVVLTMGPREIGVAAETADLGGMTDATPASLDGPELKIGFNVQYLLETLKNLPTTDVRLRLTSAERAARIEPVGDATGPMDGITLLTIVMPVRLLE